VRLVLAVIEKSVLTIRSSNPVCPQKHFRWDGKRECPSSLPPTVQPRWAAIDEHGGAEAAIGDPDQQHVVSLIGAVGQQPACGQSVHVIFQDDGKSPAAS